MVDVATRRSEAAGLREEGLSSRAIAQRLGVSHVTVQRDLNAAGAPQPERIVGTDGRAQATAAALEERRRLARALFADGWRIREIADELGVHRSTIASDLADHEWWLDAGGEEVHWRPTGHPPEELRSLLEEAPRRRRAVRDCMGPGAADRAVGGAVPAVGGADAVVARAGVGAPRGCVPLRAGADG